MREHRQSKARLGREQQHEHPTAPQGRRDEIELRFAASEKNSGSWCSISRTSIPGQGRRDEIEPRFGADTSKEENSGTWCFDSAVIARLRERERERTREGILHQSVSSRAAPTLCWLLVTGSDQPS